MRLLLIASFVCGLANGKGAEGTEPKAHVTIHLIDRANVPADVMAQAIVEASRIFQPTGVRLHWVRQGSDAAETLQAECGRLPGARFTITIQPRETSGLSSEANAIANTRTGDIAVFYNRVRKSMADERRMLPIFLGYVLAHEIGHVSQAVGQHTPSGIMKSDWTAWDYRYMEKRVLRFSASDILLIHRGLASRACSASAGAGQTDAARKAML
jgi:hypothetical protein